MHAKFWRALFGLVLSAATAASQSPRFSVHVVRKLEHERIAGYALDGRTLVTWGDRLLRTELPNGPVRVIRGAGPAFAEGGCLLDKGIVVNEASGDLVWYAGHQAGATWTRHVIDTGVDAPDMLPVTLLGHRGVLLIHKGMQVRFYEMPAEPATRWTYQEVYSFYSPSHQGGLRMADIDGDGLPDILAGMYWIRSPEKFELPWRLFAIVLWNETPESAMLRLSYGSALLAAQRAMEPARLARLEKPADPRQLWIEHRIESVPDLAQLNSLDTADFDGDGRPDILVAENAGAGRLLVLYDQENNRFRPAIVTEGAPVLFARAVDLNCDGRPDILAIRADGVWWFENHGRKR